MDHTRLSTTTRDAWWELALRESGHIAGTGGHIAVRGWKARPQLLLRPGFEGGRYWDRTSDLMRVKHALSQLS